MVRDTLPYGHAPTYQISLTYLERQKGYGPDKLRWEEAEEKIRLKQYVFLRSKEKHKYYTVVVSEQFQNTATNQPTNEKNVERDKINIR